MVKKKPKLTNSYSDLRITKVCIGLAQRGIDPEVAVDEVLSKSQYSEAMKSRFRLQLIEEIRKAGIC